MTDIKDLIGSNSPLTRSPIKPLNPYEIGNEPRAIKQKTVGGHAEVRLLYAKGYIPPMEGPDSKGATGRSHAAVIIR